MSLLFISTVFMGIMIVLLMSILVIFEFINEFKQYKIKSTPVVKRQIATWKTLEDYYEIEKTIRYP